MHDDPRRVTIDMHSVYSPQKDGELISASYQFPVREITACCDERNHCLHLGLRSTTLYFEQPNAPGCHQTTSFWRLLSLPTLRQAWPRAKPEAAICVQDVDVQCVLQFTLISADGYALHRRTSQVIHRLQL